MLPRNGRETTDAEAEADEALQVAKAEGFAKRHAVPDPLLLPNPWDVGTARLLASLGFEALGTTSLGLGNALGLREPTREAVLANCRQLSDATRLPVTADLQDGYGPKLEDVRRTISDAWQAGAVGGSIEDACPDASPRVYPFDQAVERVAAATEQARSLPGPFVVTARAENLLYAAGDLDDTIRRLKAYEAVGADVLYAPGLRTLDEMQRVVSELSRPVNVVMGFADPSITLDELRAVGVRRVSIGGALSRLALDAFLDGARAMQRGSFEFVSRIAPVGPLHDAFEAASP